MTYTSDKRLYLDQNGKVVEEVAGQGSGTLLVGAGGELPDEVAARYGLTSKKPGAKAEESPPETKQIKGAPENKGR